MSQVTYGAYTGVPAPWAAVQFVEGTTIVGTANLAANGTLASLTLNGVAPESHTYIANYPGDANYAAFTLGSATIVVVASPTVVTVGATVQAGSPTSFVATVTSAASTPARPARSASSMAPLCWARHRSAGVVRPPLS